MYTEDDLRTILFSILAHSIANFAIGALCFINLFLLLLYNVPISDLLLVAAPTMFLLNIYVDKLIKDSNIVEELEKMRNDYDS